MPENTMGVPPSEGDLPRMLDSRYRLDGKLGAGGMGVVYRGTNVTIERPVAIKLLRPEYASNEDIAERFLREARSAVKIRGSHVVEILDFGKADDGAAFFVMELLEGAPLSDVMRREGRLHIRRAVDIAAQICVGLHAAHKEGIVHRDLKPGNVVLVTQDDRADFVKILDFGVAKLLGEAEADLTRTGMLLGTVDYMAPEQIQGQPVDARTDIYALGVLLYRILTGTKPFSGDGVPAMIYHHISSEPEPLRARCPEAGIPESLDEVVRRCMAKDPGRRFSDMSKVREALLQAVDGVPVAPEEPIEIASGELSAPISMASDWVSDVSTFDKHKDEVLSGEPVPLVKRAAPGAGPPPLPTSRAAAAAESLQSDQAAPTVAAGGEAISQSGVSSAPPAEPAARRGSRNLVALLMGSAGAAVVLAAVLVAPRFFDFGETEGHASPTEAATEEASAEKSIEDGDSHALSSGDAGEPSPGEPVVMEPAGQPEEAPPSSEPEAPSPGPIVVRANAAAARVFVDGVGFGQAPVTFEPESFEPVSIRVVARGRVPFESEVRPAKDELVVQARLQRRAPRPAPRPAPTPEPKAPAAEPEPTPPPRPSGEAEDQVTGDDFFPMDL